MPLGRAGAKPEKGKKVTVQESFSRHDPMSTAQVDDALRSISISKIRGCKRRTMFLSRKSHVSNDQREVDRIANCTCQFLLQFQHVTIII
eukprot:scaffold1856_cov34-Prasinocladus_malaysianus.AAC.2